MHSQSFHPGHRSKKPHRNNDKSAQHGYFKNSSSGKAPCIRDGSATGGDITAKLLHELNNVPHSNRRDPTIASRFQMDGQSLIELVRLHGGVPMTDITAANQLLGLVVQECDSISGILDDVISASRKQQEKISDLKECIGIVLSTSLQAEAHRNLNLVHDSDSNCDIDATDDKHLDGEAGTQSINSSGGRSRRRKRRERSRRTKPGTLADTNTKNSDHESPALTTTVGGSGSTSGSGSDCGSDSGSGSGSEEEFGVAVVIPEKPASSLISGHGQKNSSTVAGSGKSNRIARFEDNGALRDGHSSGAFSDGRPAQGRANSWDPVQSFASVPSNPSHRKASNDRSTLKNTIAFVSSFVGVDNSPRQKSSSASVHEPRPPDEFELGNLNSDFSSNPSLRVSF